ncbi:MAG: PorT family protein [Prevotellaceae bacterium]|jgi:hypothetical protein|nr:PorT family protein [Prevotellaceae bacterium]
MADKFKNNFEECIRRKLENHTSPVPAGAWTSIAKSLKRRQRIRYFYLTAASVAAAGVMFLTTRNLPDSNTNTPQNQIPSVSDISNDSVKQQANKMPEIQSQTEKTDETEKTKNLPQVARQQGKQQTPPDKKHSSNAATAVSVEATYNPEDNTLTTKVVQTQDIDKNPLQNKRLQIAPSDISGLKTLGMREGEMRKNNSPDNFTKTDNRVNTREKLDLPDLKSATNWTVSMNFSAGNYQNIGTKNSDMIPPSPILAHGNEKEYIRDAYKNEISIPDNVESQYGMPLSGKLSIRKSLNYRWAVESGINYTYLSTKYKWSRNEARQQLHYLGIPVNVVYSAISRPSWGLYLSAGGAVEKGVYATIKRNDNINSPVKMKGFQYAANAAFGLTYKLYRNIGLFFEPQIGYYFNNNQPESIRTTSPLSFSLGIGLRYNLY